MSMIIKWEAVMDNTKAMAPLTPICEMMKATKTKMLIKKVLKKDCKDRTISLCSKKFSYRAFPEIKKLRNS